MKPMPDKLVAKGISLTDADGNLLAEIGRYAFAPGYDREWKERVTRTIARRYNLGAKIEKERRKNRMFSIKTR